MSGLVLQLDGVEQWVVAAFLPFCRIIGMLALLPGIGGGEIPVRVRVGLSVALTALLLPTLPPVPPVDPLSASGVLLVGQELVIGLASGLLILIVFSAVTLAGESIAITMGLGFALMNDPKNGAQVPTVSQFYLITAILLFFSLNGHLAVLSMLGQSFTTLPIGARLDDGAFAAVVLFGGTMFLGALGVALPALAAMLTVNLGMGVMNRAAPQLNLFSVGFPLTMLAGFLALLFTMPAFAESVAALFDTGHEAVGGWFGLAP